MVEGTRRISFQNVQESGALLTAGLPILVYHKIARRPPAAKWRSLYLSPALFSRHMEGLAQAGFSTTSLASPFPETGNLQRKFVLTFDDGYRNVLQHATAVLARHGFTAIQFLVCDEIGGTNAWDVAAGEVSAPLMSEGDIRAWCAAGHEIGSHTCSHPRLTQLNRPQQAREIADSKRRLEDMFGVPVRHFCYPYGDFSQSVAEVVAEAGYATACTLLGGVNNASTARFELRRIEGRYPRRNLRTFLQRLLHLVRKPSQGKPQRCS